jgi:hypothetical protein
MRRLLACAIATTFAGLAVSAQVMQPPGHGGRPFDPTSLTTLSSAEQATLGSAERAAGWKLLFDGVTTSGWRGFKKAGFPARGWSVEAGRLKHAANNGQTAADSGDIITLETFNDFDLRFEWIVAPGANSGIKYLVTESRDGPIAHEYQIIDDAKHPDALIGPHRATAALYDVIAAPATKILKPASQRNEGRILVQGNHVEHWLNGAKVTSLRQGRQTWQATTIDRASPGATSIPGWASPPRVSSSAALRLRSGQAA